MERMERLERQVVLTVCRLTSAVILIEFKNIPGRNQLAL